MAPPAGIEPAVQGLEIPCVILCATKANGVAERIRTSDPRFRKPLLYPTELQRLIKPIRLATRTLDPHAQADDHDAGPVEMERRAGVEPAWPAWKAGARPLGQRRKMACPPGLPPGPPVPGILFTRPLLASTWHSPLPLAMGVWA